MIIPSTGATVSNSFLVVLRGGIFLGPLYHVDPLSHSAVLLVTYKLSLSQSAEPILRGVGWPGLRERIPQRIAITVYLFAYSVVQDHVGLGAEVAGYGPPCFPAD